MQAAPPRPASGGSSTEASELIGVTRQVYRGDALNQPLQGLGGVGHDVASGQDQTMHRRVELRCGELFGDVTKQPATPVYEFNPGPAGRGPGR